MIMKRTRKYLALLLALVLVIGLLAGCAADVDDKPQDTAPQQSEPDEALTYTWDVTVMYYRFDLEEHFEPIPVIKMTNSASKDQVLTIDPSALTQDEVLEMLDESNKLPMTAELQVTDPSSAIVDNAEAWIIDDGNSGAAYLYEVVTPLTEGDTETHGELVVTVVAKDYTWNIEVVYENGACGTYEFVNPGLQGDWDVKYGEQYCNQRFTFTPDNTTAQLQIFNHQDWIVDNTRTWYQWVVTDVDDEAAYITYEVIEPLTMGDRMTPGLVRITISL